MSHLRPTAIRHHLRATALLLALVPAAATLASCGFDYPTDRVNTIGSGDNNRDHTVDALGIRVLATAKGEGRLIGSLANNLDERASLEGVASPDGDLEVAAFSPVAVQGRSGVNLADQPAIDLTGDFTAGDVVALELTFSTGETARVDAPVVKACFQYTQVPVPTPAESEKVPDGETDPADAGEAEEGEAAGAAAEEEGESHGEDGHEEGGDATFNCADEAPAPEGAH